MGGTHPRSRWGGVLHPADGWGGVPHSKSGWGYPILLTGGYPILLTGGAPHPADRRGVPCPRSGQRGSPSKIRTGGTPCQNWMGYPRSWHPGLDGVTRPPSPHQETDQHSEHLLRGRQYASCVHTGLLSCLFSKAKNISSKFHANILEVISKEGHDAENSKLCIELVFMYKQLIADRRHQCWIIYTLMVNNASHYLFYIQAEQSQRTNKFHRRCSMSDVSRLSILSGFFALVS